jgi:serine/threonine-protein kinase SRPK3
MPHGDKYRRLDKLRLDRVGDIEQYEVGAFHPVAIGDQYRDDRYIVLHKLGAGGHATIWLGRDRDCSRYVALKIMAADVSQHQHDIHILEHLKHIPSVLDSFWITGPNGSHLCQASKVAGPSIRQLNDPGANQMEGTRRLRGTLAQKVACQVIQALAYIHARRVVHGGKFQSRSRPI